MKKTIISTAVSAIVAFSSVSAFAEEEINWEAELNMQSEGLEELSFDDILGNEDVNLIEMEETAEVEKQIEKPKEEGNVKTDDTPKAINAEIVDDLLESTNDVEKVKETKIANEMEVTDSGFDFIDSDPMMEADPSDLVFLRYVPEGTRFTIKDTFKILPKKKYIIMHEGKRVLKNPQTELEPEKTLCYIKLKPSGKARILKANTPFIVTKTAADVNDTEKRKSYGTFTLRTHHVSFAVDNPNVVNMSCYSAKMFKKGIDEEPMPLLIKDLKNQMGDNIQIDFPAYEEI